MTDVELQGYKAFHQGIGIIDNPFDELNPNWAAWRYGWTVALGETV